MKAIERYVRLVPFIVLYEVLLTFKSYGMTIQMKPLWCKTLFRAFIRVTGLIVTFNAQSL